MPKPPARPFVRRSSRVLFETPIFQLREDRAAHPGTGDEAPYYVLQSPDWVNLVAVTVDGELLLVRQWRHGSRDVELELPAGLVDPGEDALTAATRELREETGYAAESLAEIGVMLPNPAYQDNRCTTFLAQGCRRVGDLQLDADEDIEVVTARPGDLRDLVRSGQLRNSVVLTAVFWWLDHTGRIDWP